MVKKLEEEIDTIIFDRNSHPILPTLKGNKVIDLAKEILTKQKEIENIGREKTEIAGPISIGIIPTIATSLLPIVLRPILKAYPKLLVSIKEITTDEIIQQLIDEKIDIGILATPLDNASIFEKPIFYESMMVYGAKEPDKQYVLPEELANQKIWLLEEGHCFRNQTLEVCNIQAKQTSLENFDFEGNSFETLLNLTDQFGGYTLIPELYYESLSDDRKIKSKPFIKPVPVREISIVYYRPFAKLEIIKAVHSLIQESIIGKLSTLGLKQNEMAVVSI